jgi:hypothetical protein
VVSDVSEEGLSSHVFNILSLDHSTALLVSSLARQLFGHELKACFLEVSGLQVHGGKANLTNNKVIKAASEGEGGLKESLVVHYNHTQSVQQLRR